MKQKPLYFAFLGMNHTIDENRIVVGRAGAEEGNTLNQLGRRLDAALAERCNVSKDDIRSAFLANGFTIKDGETDLKPYVYEAARALLALVQR